MRAWMVGHLRIATASEGDGIVNTLLMYANEDSAVIHLGVTENGERWRGCPPGSTSLLVLCPFCRTVIILPVDYERFDGPMRWNLTHNEPPTIDREIACCRTFVITDGDVNVRPFSGEESTRWIRWLR